MNHIGTQTIETERLILRKVQIDDVEQMYSNWAKDPENVKYVTWSAHKNIDETKKVISDWISEYKNPNCYRWMITLRSNSSVIGNIDVIDSSDENECCEIGYVLSKKYWNNGYMTEALHSVLNYLFKKVGFHRIQLRHDVDNIASGRVMEKNGLKFEGIIRDARKTNRGTWCDTCLYSILEHEFKN